MVLRFGQTMKISEQWLREWVPTSAGVEVIAEKLTMAGLEVDDILEAGPCLAGVVVGEITSGRPHPQADRLQICDVDVGAPQPLRIVCGAPNAREGLKAPLAKAGARLPGLTVEASMIRGERSDGMLCSASELGLSADAEGLWALPASAPVGASLDELLALPDKVLDIDLTPNRGDCLSVRGVARELAAMLDTTFTDPAVTPPVEHHTLAQGVFIDAPARCAGYAARVIRGVCVNAATPTFITERLRRAGIRCINLPVDIGNYVMLELGQPMHAFDADRLVGTIHVRMAEAGEQIVTLDGENVTLDNETLVIADDEGPVAIAGIIGGQRTAVDDKTVNVVYESACFTPAAVAGQGRRYKIQTDALHRFERGVDPLLHPVALDRATGLLIAYGQGECGPVSRVEGETAPERRRIELGSAHIARLLGQPVEAAWLAATLPKLGIDLEPIAEDRWLARPPSWRFDLAIEADLIEEVARLYGYDRLNSASQGVDLPTVQADDAQPAIAAADSVLRQRGYSEAITYSFVEPALQAALTDNAPTVVLDNPISEQFVEMRRTLWASLLPSWAHNVRRQRATVRLYERGLRFLPSETHDNGIEQRETIAGLVAGAADDVHWDRTTRAVDFFDVKGDVEALLAGTSGAIRYVADRHPALHPGRSARIEQDGVLIGWLGQIAPHLNKIFKNKTLPYVFEIDSSILTATRTVRFQRLSEQPSVRRDLAVIIEESVPVGALKATIESLDIVEIQAVEIFDLFRGEGVETGFKSVALGLIFQDKASTLTDERVATIITRIMTALREQCGAQIRGA